jgi:hypothetical protein
VYAPVSGAVTGGMVDTKEDSSTVTGPNIYAPVTSDISSAATEEMSKFAAEFALSMIPIIGDGSGVAKELYNLFTTGEIDELNLTLSLLGLAMDLPFDAGVAGDLAIATLKGFSAMIPSGPAREVLLEVFKVASQTPNAFFDFVETVRKLMGNEALLQALAANPKAFKAILEASPEAVENLAAQGDEAVQLVKGLDEDGVKAVLEGGDDTAINVVKETEKYTDYVNEAGTQIRINKQTSQAIDNKIADNLVNTDIGKRTEAEVANFIKNNTNAQITDLGNKVKNASGGTLGDIDCATVNEIIEVKKSIGDVDIKQFTKYLDPTFENYINIQNKNVILYIDKQIDMTIPANLYKIEQLQDLGVTITNGLDELKGVIK